MSLDTLCWCGRRVHPSRRLLYLVPLLSALGSWSKWGIGRPLRYVELRFCGTSAINLHPRMILARSFDCIQLLTQVVKKLTHRGLPVK